MQLKHLLVALVVLLALVGTAAAADSVEIRSTILHYTDITADPADNAITPADWAGLWYDLDDNTSTETIGFYYEAGEKGDVNITYTTIPAFQHYEYDGWFDNNTPADNYGYAVIGFFAEPYVALGKKDVVKPNEPALQAAVDAAQATYDTEFAADPGSPETAAALVALNNAKAALAAALAEVGDIKATKIAKLVMDDDEKYTLKTGATLELGSGYSVIVDQIDVDGNKAYLKLMKDGKELNSSIVNTNDTESVTSSTWIFDLTVLGDKNIQVMRIHVKDVFQGTESSLVEIDGMWMVDYLNAIEVKSDDKYGKWECDQADNNILTFLADEISLSADSEISLGQGIYLKTEKEFVKTDADFDKFYIYKEYTEPGTYEIRSSVFDYGTWAFINGARPLVGDADGDGFDFTNFAAFFYDMDNSVDTEQLLITEVAGAEITNGSVEYKTTPRPIEYEYDWTVNRGEADGITPEFYFIMGFFGEKYVPFNVVDVNGTFDKLEAEKMAKLVIDDDEKYTLKTGATLELGEGYTVIVDQIDVDGNKAYLKFLKDGKEVNSSIVNTNESMSNWILRQNITNEKNVQVLRIHVKDVFQGTQDSLVEIDGLWLMDYQNATEIKSDDKYGLLEYDGVTDGAVVTATFGDYDFEYTEKSLEFTSTSKVSMSSDMDKQIANNMYLKTADSTENKLAYFYVNAIVDGENNTTPPTTPSDGNNTTEPTPTPSDGNNTTPPTTPDPEPSFWSKYMWYIIGAVVLIIIIAGAAYYFMVYKKQA